LGGEPKGGNIVVAATLIGELDVIPGGRQPFVRRRWKPSERRFEVESRERSLLPALERIVDPQVGSWRSWSTRGRPTLPECSRRANAIASSSSMKRTQRENRRACTNASCSFLSLTPK
jgi:hypothetical protein